MKHVQAKNYRKHRRGQITDICLHDMESAEKPDTAEAVADWFAGKHAPIGSAHVCVDCNSAVRCVLDEDEAYGAPGLNECGLHIEIPGRWTQTEEQWLDDYSSAALDIAAQVCADWCAKYGIPVRFVDAAALLRGEHGITFHSEVSKAFRRSTHVDPGPHFPIDEFLTRVAERMPRTQC